MLSRAGQTGQVFYRPAVAAVPAKPGALPRQGVPADGGIHIIQQETVSARQGHALRDQTLTFAGFQAPEKNALEVRVAVEQKSLFGLKGGGQLLEEQAQRFRQSLIHLHGRADPREKLDLRRESAVSVPQKNQAYPPRKRAGQKAKPSAHPHPVHFPSPPPAHNQKPKKPTRKR